jgi:SAM-dependent methyltransferase
MDGDPDRERRQEPERHHGHRAARLRRALDEARADDGDPDAEFDAAYPPAIRAVSSCFWSPVRVALRAAELLVTSRASRVLDVGSGVGKFCIVGAAATGATFMGVEHRPRFVSVAERVAEAFGVTSAHFQCATFSTVDLEDFDGVYLFNPFEENLWGPVERLDETVPLSRERFARDTVRAERLLASARVGTRVVTYYGFGSVVPPGFRLALRERQRSGHLELWVKTEDIPWPQPLARNRVSWLRGRTIRALQAAYRNEAL